MLVLDEPSEGLDPVAIEILLQLPKDLAAEGVTIFFPSHQLADVEVIANRFSSLIAANWWLALVWTI
jgi:ABC-2 type transport system ATP-binding protein